LPRGRGGFGRGYGVYGGGYGRGYYGSGYGQGVGWFGFGRGIGNPYPFCRRFPWLPKWWWAYPAFAQPYYGRYGNTPYYSGYMPQSYTQSFPYSPYGTY
jgi:hypothetical protein